MRSSSRVERSISKMVSGWLSLCPHAGERGLRRASVGVLVGEWQDALCLGRAVCRYCFLKQPQNLIWLAG